MRSLLQGGQRRLRAWMRERFPDADIVCGDTWDRDNFYRWTVDFGPGKATLRLGATEHVIETPDILETGLHELDTNWLQDVGETSRCLLLTSEGVAVRRPPEDW